MDRTRIATLFATQRISRIRREYNSWVGNETLEDFALRFAPRSFRKWSEAQVAITALGSVSFLALEAIGGAIYIDYGFSNAVAAILVVGLMVFLVSTPISYYAAKHNLDIDLVARGAGFGYIGSTVTSLIYASFTFIFFALEAAIMAKVLDLAFAMPLALGYVICSVIIIPLVTHGVTFISRMQYLTLIPWLVLMLLPYAYILGTDSAVIDAWRSYQGRYANSSEFDPLYFGYAATVSFSLVAQIGEQVDFLRFMPEKGSENGRRWWAAVLLSGPGWIIPGVLKQIGGTLLAFLTLQQQVLPEQASDPTQMYLNAYRYIFPDLRWAIVLTTLFVVLSQIKINVTNAYAGSLAWSNFFSRLTHSHPGRVVWLVFNVAIALLLMQMGLFAAFAQVLGLYACVAIAWVGTLAADLVINKSIGLSPPGIEFRRAYLRDINPVGIGSTISASGIGILAFLGYAGPYAQAYAPFLALLSALLLAPLIAYATGGKYYLARRDDRVQGAAPALCCICETAFEPEDTAYCPAYAGTICSLCCTLDARCQDLCKRPLLAHAGAARAPERGGAQATGLVRNRVADYLLTFALMAAVITTVLFVTRYQGGTFAARTETMSSMLSIDGFLLKVWLILLVLAGIATWWLVLTKESRAVAQEESTRQTQLLLQEIEEHSKTDAKLRKAKEAADAANRAKSRFLGGMSHELRSPLNSILGYAELLLTGKLSAERQHEGLEVIQQSGQHLLSLVEDILDLSKIEAGKFRLEPYAIDFPALLRQLIDMFRPQATRKGLRFDIIVESPLPEYVRVEERRLRQILINLLSNAIKYTDEGGVTLAVKYSGNSVTFRVKDTGPGIAEEDLKRIFEPFQRVARHHRAAIDGTGLGLSICKLMLHQMGGELTVSTEVERGSVFQVRMFLPTAQKPVTIASATITATSPHGVRGYEGVRRNVLVVDDQAEHRTVIDAILSGLGFAVEQAGNGAECLTKVRGSVPDIVLLDLVMPGLSGFDVARLLRTEVQFSGPILAVSANAFDEDRDRSIAAGCNGFIAKPVQRTLLLQQLQLHLGLVWHDRVRDNPPATDTAIKYPPTSCVATLHRFLDTGYLHGIVQTAEQLHIEDAAYAPFARQLLTLAHGFHLEELRRFINQIKSGEPADD